MTILLLLKNIDPLAAMCGRPCLLFFLCVDVHIFTSLSMLLLIRLSWMDGCFTQTSNHDRTKEKRDVNSQLFSYLASTHGANGGRAISLANLPLSSNLHFEVVRLKIRSSFHI